MAEAADVASVRLNINEPTPDTFTDATIEAWLDTLGSVDAASAAGWRAKAALYVDLVDEKEANTSHSFSDLHKNALAMATSYDKAVAAAGTASSGVRVRQIERL